MSKTDMTLNPIRTEADYRAALKRAEAFFDAVERPLTLPMIRRLHQGLGIPADVLIAEPPPGYGDKDL